MKLTPTMGGAYSGSLGGLTASHNAGGAYFRRRSVPTNPNTSRQQTVRALVGTLVAAWSDELTEAERQAWRDYAANTPFTDTLGQSITMSGLNSYIKSNVARMQFAVGAGVSPNSVRLDAAPVIFDTGIPPATVGTFSGVFTTPPGTVTVAVPLGVSMTYAGVCFLFIAPPQTAGTRFYKGPYQLAAMAVVSPPVTTINFTALDLSDAAIWQSDTTPVAAWDTLFVPLRVVNRADDGRYSQVWRGLVQFTDATP